MLVGLDVPPLWLRDACSCGECRDEFSGQRLRSVLALDPEPTSPRGGRWRRHRGDVRARRPRVPLLEVVAERQRAGRAEVFDDRSERTARRGSRRSRWAATRVAWPTCSDGAPRAAALGALLAPACSWCATCPTSPAWCSRSRGRSAYVRTTNYGDLFDVRVEPQPVNLAFTGRAIAPHTDNPYREPVPGSSCCTACNRRPAAERTSSSTASPRPRWSATRIRRRSRRLTSTPLTFRYEDADTLLRASGPIITLNAAGDVRGIRWNDRSIQPPTVPPQDVAEVYRAMRVFAAVLERPELHLRLTLEPGDCIVFDNTRVLHARTAFEGGSGCSPPAGLLRRSRWPGVDRGGPQRRRPMTAIGSTSDRRDRAAFTRPRAWPTSAKT